MPGLRKSRQTSISMEQIHDEIVAMGFKKCMATCPALGSYPLTLHGEQFDFCPHHAQAIVKAEAKVDLREAINEIESLALLDAELEMDVELVGDGVDG